MKQQLLTITENSPVTAAVYRMRLESPDLEQQKPGGFVNIRLDGLFLRRPISVYDSEPGCLTILYKVVGKGTEQLAGMKPGETLDVLTVCSNSACPIQTLSVRVTRPTIQASLGEGRSG